MKKSILATAIVSLYAPALFAQDTDSTKVDETIVVTANRFEQTQTSALASVSVVEREQIEQLQADSAFDVLKTLPGVEIASQGTKGNANNIYLRGSNYNHTLVLLDGVRLNTAAGGNASLGLIPAFAIERIEVIRGPRASIYGSDAIGGVISIITKPENGSVHELTLNGGSNHYHQEGFRSSGELSDTTQGNFVVSNEASKGYKIFQDATDDHYGYKSQVVLGGLNHQINKNWSTGFQGYAQQSDAEYASLVYDDITYAYVTNEKNQEDKDLYTISAHITYGTDDFNSKVQASFANEKAQDGRATLNAEKTEITSERSTVSWINTYTGVDYLTLNAGADYYYEEAHNGGSMNGYPVGDFTENTRNNTAVFATSALDYKQWLAELSVRHDDNSAYGGNTTWGMAAGWYVTNQILLSGSYGTAFKAPSFFDLYYPGFENPTLKPETSEQYEVGITGYHSLLTWNIVAYQSNIDNLIASDALGNTTNINEAEITGLEVTLDFDTGPISHILVADWKDPEDKSNNRQLDRRAKENYKWVMNYGYQDINLSLATVYTGERPDANGTKELDAYTTMDIAASYAATENLDLKFKVDNLLDEEYETAYDASSGYSWVGAERSYYAGINYRF
ncbi:TonB-dependent receptor [Vibrio breoganii]